jgi:hypothetical protein
MTYTNIILDDITCIADFKVLYMWHLEYLKKIMKDLNLNMELISD